jgi:hypothetical protein
VKAGVFDAALIVEMQRNPGMAFDSGYGIDHDGSALFHCHS